MPDRLPRPHPDVEVASLVNGIVAFDPRNTMAHELLGTPAVVLDACVEGLATAAIIDELVAAGVGDDASVRGLIAAVLADLADLGLLEGCAAPVPPPCIECGRDEPVRRTWWRRSQRSPRSQRAQ